MTKSTVDGVTSDQGTAGPATRARQGARRPGRFGRGAGLAAGLLLAVGALVCAVAFAGIVSPLLPDHTSSSAPPGVPSYLAVRGMPPLACGDAPLSALTAEGGAETADTPEAAGLRDVIAHDPTGGMSPKTPHNWVLLRHQGTEVDFGQREGLIGIRATVSLRQQGSRYVWSGSGGCGPIGYDDGTTAVSSGSYTNMGDHLDVTYAAGACGALASAVNVAESATEVDVLIALPPRPVAGPDCTAEGLHGVHISVPLSQPLAGRQVMDGSSYPASPMQPAGS